jgi:cytochrome b
MIITERLVSETIAVAVAVAVAVEVAAVITASKHTKKYYY